MAEHPGQPTKYTQELADRICNELALGKSIRTVCAIEGMPAIATIFNWFRTQPEFLEQYARAKQEAADAMAEDILDIADDGTNDWTKANVRGKQVDVPDREVIQRSQLRVETRKWLMAKMKPKRYGDKLDVTTDGEKLPAPIYGGVSVQGHNGDQEGI